jgi:hypothetical protein
MARYSGDPALLYLPELGGCRRCPRDNAFQESFLGGERQLQRDRAGTGHSGSNAGHQDRWERILDQL